MTAENTIQNEHPKGVTSKLKRLGAGLLTALVAVTGMTVLPSSAQAAEGDNLPRLTSTVTTTVPVRYAGIDAALPAEVIVTRSTESTNLDGTSPVKFRVDVSVNNLILPGPSYYMDSLFVDERLGESWRLTSDPVIVDGNDGYISVLNPECSYDPSSLPSRDDYENDDDYSGAYWSAYIDLRNYYYGVLGCSYMYSQDDVADLEGNDFRIRIASSFSWPRPDVYTFSYEYEAVPVLDDGVDFEPGTASCASSILLGELQVRMAGPDGKSEQSTAMPNSFPQDCAAIGVPILADPVEPDFTASTECGVESVVTLPETEGVVYEQSRDGSTVTVTATPAQGYGFADDAETEWTYDVSAEECPIEVTPVAPELAKSDECGVPSTLVIPEVEGVEYTVGEPDENGDFIITAEALEGFEIAEGAPIEWEANLGEVTPCEEESDPASPPASAEPEQPTAVESKAVSTGGTVTSSLLAVAALLGTAGTAALIALRRRRET